MMKPRILVLYYSQTGQMLDIVNNILSDVKDKVTIDYALIEPVKPYKLPWKPNEFFDVMPETVQLLSLIHI